jgi:hypothetical protein
VTVAHQGGWDEALFVIVPMAIFVLLLVRAKRRAEAEAASEHDGAVDREGDPGTSLPER